MIKDFEKDGTVYRFVEDLGDTCQWKCTELQENVLIDGYAHVLKRNPTRQDVINAFNGNE